MGSKKKTLKVCIDCPFADTNHRVRLYETFLTRKLKLPIYFLENHKYLSCGKTYLTKRPNYDRFLFFCAAAKCFLERWGFKPDIIHLHDWHTALIPPLVKYSPKHFWEIVGLPKPKIIFTIHNLDQNPIIKKRYLEKLDFIPQEAIDSMDEKVNLLKVAIENSDIVTTVSPTYREEVQKDSSHPQIARLLRNRKDTFFGVLNGIDVSYWNIRRNTLLPYNLKISTRLGIEKFKKITKATLLKKAKLKDNKPIFAFVGRLYRQKGLEILFPAIKQLLEKKADFNFILLGQGSKKFQQQAERLESKFPKNIYIETKYDEPFAHLLYAGSDFLLVPSLFEPCGLIQMIGAKYSAIPIVRKTGGLADTIIDGKEGLVFDDFSIKSLISVIKRAQRLYKNKPKMLKIIKCNLLRDFSWQQGAQKYVKLYMQALAVPREEL